MLGSETLYDDDYYVRDEGLVIWSYLYILEPHYNAHFGVHSVITEQPYNEGPIHRKYKQWKPCLYLGCYKQISAIKEGVIMRLQCFYDLMLKKRGSSWSFLFSSQGCKACVCRERRKEPSQPDCVDFMRSQHAQPSRPSASQHRHQRSTWKDNQIWKGN